jgi:hypothetical protein
VKDVSEKFGLGNINTIMLNPDSSFERTKHYVLFKSNKLNKPESNTNKKGNNNSLFLTFVGLTKLLYVSQSQNAEHFQQWANNILFIHKLGTPKEKVKLAKQLGYSVKDSINLLKSSHSNISSIYLMFFGYVKDLRKTFNIPDTYNDDNMVIKYGRSCDLCRRLKELDNKYGKLENVQVRLLFHSYIDVDNVPKAETTIKHFMETCKYNLCHDVYNELGVVNSKELKNIENQYNMIIDTFAGNNKELIYKISSLEKEYQLRINKLQCDIIVLEKENGFLKKHTTFLENLINKLNIISR